MRSAISLTSPVPPRLPTKLVLSISIRAGNGAPPVARSVSPPEPLVLRVPPYTTKSPLLAVMFSELVAEMVSLSM